MTLLELQRQQAAYALAYEIEHVCAKREARARGRNGARLTWMNFYDQHAATELAELILKRMP